MPYEDLIAHVQRHVDNGQGATIEQSRALLELLAALQGRLAEIRGLRLISCCSSGRLTFRIRCREHAEQLKRIMAGGVDA